MLLYVCGLPHGGSGVKHLGGCTVMAVTAEREYMRKLVKSVGVASAAVAFAAGSALVAPVAGAQSSSLPGGSLGGEQCGEQVVTPDNREASGWGTPGDETAAEIAAVEGAPDTVGDAAVTFPEDNPEQQGTSLYKNADRMPLADLLGEDGNPVPLSYEYTSEGQAPALQIRLNDANLAETEDSAGHEVGFATIVWSPADGDGSWQTANPGDSDEFWVTRALVGGEGDDVPRGERKSLKEIIELNPDAVVTAYGVQMTRDNESDNVAVDSFTLDCETTNFELDSEDGLFGSLTDVFGSVTGSLGS